VSGRPGPLPKLGLLPDDLPGESAQLVARPKTETVLQGSARPLVDLECLRLTIGAVQRHHELGDEALSVRAFLDVPVELAHDLLVASQRKIRVETDLECSRPKLLEALGLCTAARVQGNAREDRTAPEAYCLPGECPGPGMVAGVRRPARVLHERHEDPSVELGAAEVEPISPCTALDRHSVPCERPAEPRHVRLQAVTG
jgi:hypothetical protein